MAHCFRLEGDEQKKSSLPGRGQPASKQQHASPVLKSPRGSMKPGSAMMGQRVCVCKRLDMASSTCRGPGGVGRGSLSPKPPLPNPVKTYLPVPALGPSAGSCGIQSSSCSFASHFVLCHSRCLAQRGHDPYPHSRIISVFRMPFRRSGIHGTKKFISFVVIITITSFIIYLSSPEFCASVLAKPESVCVCVCARGCCVA